MAAAPGRYCANRLFEWVMAAALVNTGVILLIWPGTLARGNLRPLLELVGPREMMALCLTVGSLRALTLFLNGRLGRYGPVIRAVVASLSLLAWSDMVAALWLRLGQPSLVTGILLAVIGGELRSIGRARVDLHGGRH